MARSFEDSDHLHDGDVKSILAQDKAASPSLLALHITLLAELSQDLGEVVGGDSGRTGNFLSQDPMRRMACKVPQNSEGIFPGLRNHLYISVDDYIH